MVDIYKPLRDLVFEYENKHYTNLGSDYSVTTLLQPPRIVQLERRHGTRILPSSPEKLSRKEMHDSLVSMTGTAVHDILEKMTWRIINRGPDSGYLVERRMWDRLWGRKISGKFDGLVGDMLYDYKRTSVWKYVYGDTFDWEAQLNMYAYLLGLMGVFVGHITVFVLFRDWEQAKAWDRGYPKYNHEAIPLKVWALEEQEMYLQDRIELHKVNEDLPDWELTHCTAKDKWEKPAKWAVYKLKEGKRPKKATRLLDTEEGAGEYIRKMKLKETEVAVEYRPGNRTRCEDWCNVKEFCNQYKEEGI